MMDAKPNAIRIAAAQVSPVFLDRRATTERACEWIAEAGRHQVDLLAFPESFIPTYPDWVWAVPAGDDQLHHDLYAEFLANAVDVPGPETDELCQAAKQAGVFTVVGINERNCEASGGSLYNSLLFINDQGKLLGKHRKLVPTAGERLVWAQGDGSTLAAYDTSIGRVSGLICWENYMPLARYALYAWGVQIYVAATWDRGDVWQASMRHIAKEGGMVVIGAGMPLRRSDIPDRYRFKQYYPQDGNEWINPGDSVVIAPGGDVIAGPLHEAEGLVTAEVAVDRLQGSKWMLDVAGHYARPDVFELTVNRSMHPMVRPG